MGQIFYLVIVVAVLGVTLPMDAAARKYTGDEDLAVVWKQYARNSATVEPGMKYPFAHCFRRASIVNQVPETLLLAQKR